MTADSFYTVIAAVDVVAAIGIGIDFVAVVVAVAAGIHMDSLGCLSC